MRTLLVGNISRPRMAPVVPFPLAPFPLHVARLKLSMEILSCTLYKKVSIISFVPNCSMARLQFYYYAHFQTYGEREYPRISYEDILVSRYVI